MRIQLIVVLLAFSIIFLVTAPSVADQPTVFVSIAPQKSFVQQISGDLINVEILVQPGASPHTYEPKPSQMKALSSSAAFFAIGVTFEEVWLKRISGVNPRMRIVHTDADIEKLAMAQHHHDEDEAEHRQTAPDKQVHHHEHDQTGLDPHIWLSPSLVKIQVGHIAAALSELFPEQAVYFQQNLAAFLSEIDALDRDLRTTLADKQGMQFLVFHPSWGYFAHEYGLVQVAVEISGKDPKPSQLEELIEHAGEHDIRVVFAQPQFSTKSAELIAREIGGEVILIDPLAQDWLSNMRAVADRLENALR